MKSITLWHPDASEKKPIALRIINAVMIVAVFVINGIATQGLLGRTTEELSDLYPVLITPAGYAFSIWGLIYALLAAFLIYQLVPVTYDSRPINEAITFLIPVNAFFNIGWLFAWHYQTDSILWLSLVAMIGLWITLAMINYRLVQFTPADSWWDYICVNLPFSLYLGWINVASVLNIFIVFKGYVTDPSDEAQVSLIQGLSIAALVLVAVLITIVFTYRRDPAPMLVFVWAAIGIMVEQSDNTIDMVALGSAITVGIIAILVWAYNIFEIVKGTRASWDKPANFLPTSSQSLAN